jgi:hypothetical protein
MAEQEHGRVIDEAEVDEIQGPASGGLIADLTAALQAKKKKKS